MVARLGAGALWRSIWFVTTLPRERCSEGAAMFTCSELRINRCPSVCGEAPTSMRQTRDRLELAQSVAAVDDVSREEESGDILGRPHSSVQSSRRRLHVHLGHPKNNVLLRHLRHANATQPALEAARNFECFACEAAKHPRVARQSSPVEVQTSRHATRHATPPSSSHTHTPPLNVHWCTHLSVNIRVGTIVRLVMWIRPPTCRTDVITGICSLPAPWHLSSQCTTFFGGKKWARV